jgi:hypothetical protein
LAAPAHAQLSEAQPGQRVRAFVPAILEERFHATFVRATHDSVWLREAHGRTISGRHYAPQLKVSRQQIVAFDVSVGRDHMRGARNGLLTGLVGSVALMAAGAAANTEFSAVLAVGGSMIFLPVATIAGAVLGAEKWRRVVPERSSDRQ